MVGLSEERLVYSVPFSFSPVVLLGLFKDTFLKRLGTNSLHFTVLIVVDDGRDLRSTAHLLVCRESIDV